MKLFRITLPQPEEKRLRKFLDDNFVSPGFAGQAALTPEAAEALRLFEHGMQDGDYIIVADQEWAYLGDLGDYFFDEVSDGAGEGLGHRRGVTWLKSAARTALNPALRHFLDDMAPVAEYPGPLPAGRMDLWFTEAGTPAENQGPGTTGVMVDEETVREALAVLKAALRSENPERRERAAIAILQYCRYPKKNREEQ
ncbi:hypothetical protein [Paenibacillus sp. NFR01]|uniref:hypothetical protein n=1 Tax=Paenibacillus sp. NFR01 TaxID=1566279 RepID=UPI0008AC22F8|nr:hypothetical protein [Paenibacillus sp. NFR01]SET37763.1 hypothetical protein SAMN03159358_1504 [Paenibacillus sp. NFR01]